MPAAVAIRHFTDPACPFAFSAEPFLRRVEWLYGDALEWETVMVLLSRSVAEYEEKGLTPAMLAGGARSLQEAHGMPIDVSERPRLAASLDACRAVVAARLHAPERADALLRRLRVLNMAGGLLDDPALLARAAAEAGLDPTEVSAWVEEEAVAEALEADAASARDPLPAALGLDHKLAGPADERRYTCPSLELRAGGETLALPGFQPLESYEAAIANLAPGVARRADPGGVEEVLGWAPFALATAEVAAVCARDAVEVRSELARSGAAFAPAGADGYWTLAA